MKKVFILPIIFLFIVINKCYAQEVEYPKPIGYVNDFANVIPDKDEIEISQLIYELKQKTKGVEIAVVTIESIAPLTIEEYAVRLYEKWGIGKKGVDNGVLVLLAIKERKMRIEVGYGLEGVLPDGKCGEIRDRFMIPYFKQGEFGKGVVYGTVAIIQIVVDEYNVQLKGCKGYSYSRQREYEPSYSPLQILLFLLLILLFGKVLSFPLALLSGGYWYRGGGSVIGGFGGGFGGFSGFGGGLSGGGGASGSW